jgi:uncharacterized protein YjbI with pentapeptide repeats
MEALYLLAQKLVFCNSDLGKVRDLGVFPQNLSGVHLKSVYLKSVCFMGVYLTGVHLRGVHLMGVHLIDVSNPKRF